MTDEQLRVLEREAETGGDAERGRFLAELVRVGKLARETVVFAAWLGDKGARRSLLPQTGMLLKGAMLRFADGDEPSLEDVPHELLFVKETGALKIAADAAVKASPVHYAADGPDHEDCEACELRRRMASKDDKDRILAARDACGDDPTLVREAIRRALLAWTLGDYAPKHGEC